MHETTPPTLRDQGREQWRAQAAELGVNPDEPDDAKFWAALARARGLIDSFRYHQPDASQIDRIARIRQAHIACAKTILQCTAVGPDQTAALRKLHESMMTANKAVVCEANDGGRL